MFQAKYLSVIQMSLDIVGFIEHFLHKDVGKSALLTEERACFQDRLGKSLIRTKDVVKHHQWSYAWKGPSQACLRSGLVSRRL